ncbi:hypothetical protein Tco_0936803 [Tanacetum coccineum]|uniref:Uncharacterized protein n=1 Tax=Tanacetum coccineum TaxID=301880 RepID=A0ABQ5DDB3_9ASTR
MRKELWCARMRVSGGGVGTVGGGGGCGGGSGVEKEVVVGDLSWCLCNTLSDVIFFMERGTSLSTGASAPQSYSPGSSRNAECSNCKHLLDKITVLEATVEMCMNPEQHTVNSAALLHEVYNDIGKLDLE